MTSGQFDHYAVTKAAMCCLYFLLGNQILLLVSMLSPSSVTMLSPRRHMPLCWSPDPSRHIGILQVVAASKWDWEAGDPENLKRHGWHCQIMNKSRWRHSQVTGVALQTWSNCNQLSSSSVAEVVKPCKDLSLESSHLSIVTEHLGADEVVKPCKMQFAHNHMRFQLQAVKNGCILYPLLINYVFRFVFHAYFAM